jgi:hypothetical protein
MKNIRLRNQVLQFAPRLVLVPLAGFFLTIAVSYVLDILRIGSLETQNFLDMWIIPVLVGVAIGLLINYRQSVVADYFVWIGPALFVLQSWFASRHSDFGYRHGFISLYCGNDNDCPDSLSFTQVLLFSVFYSIATACRRGLDERKVSSKPAQ